MGFGPATGPAIEESAASKLPDLLARIEALGTGYKCEVLMPGGKESPEKETDIAVVTVGLMVQLSYVNEFNPNVIQEKMPVLPKLFRIQIIPAGSCFPRR